MRRPDDGRSHECHPGDIPPRSGEACDEPSPPGSPSGIMTIGIVRVALFAAWAAAVVVTTMMSALSRRQSENNREPDPPHGHLGGGWLAGSLADLNSCWVCSQDLDRDG